MLVGCSSPPVGSADRSHQVSKPSRRNGYWLVTTTGEPAEDVHMRVRGLGYRIGAGLGALGLIGVVLWVSMVSARAGNQVVVPDQAADAAAENVSGPSHSRSKADEQRATPEPVGVDTTALSRLRSRPVTGSDTAREQATERAKEQAADASALAETDDNNESSSRVLQVETDGAESKVKRSDGTPAADGDAGDKDRGTTMSTAEPTAGTSTDPGQVHAGDKSDKRGSVNDADNSTPGHSGGTSKPKADNERNAASTTAKSGERSTSTTAKPTTQSTARETTSTTASTTTRPPTTAKPTTTKAPTTTAGSGGGGNQAVEQRVIELTNDARRQAGCPALVHNDKLRLAAYLHSKDMSDNDYFSHTGLDGSSPWERIARQGYSGGAAENIAWGYRTPEAVVEGWMNSSGHRGNILNCSLTEIGVGFHNYYWTQNFGIPR